MLKRIYLIRHGETDWNVQKRWQGFEPVSLNEQGFEQARALAEYLRVRPIRAVYSSDLSRAMQTATVLAGVLGLTLQTDFRWRELNLGIFQGLTYDEIVQNYPEELAAWRADYLGYRVPRGETRLEMQTRAYEAWQAVIAEAQGPEVAIVSHGGTIKLLLMKLFPSEAATLRQVDLSNTSITTLERNGQHWRLAELAATPHLSSADGYSGESQA